VKSALVLNVEVFTTFTTLVSALKDSCGNFFNLGAEYQHHFIRWFMKRWVLLSLMVWIGT